jgi:hypothetical protein
MYCRPDLPNLSTEAESTVLFVLSEAAVVLLGDGLADFAREICIEDIGTSRLEVEPLGPEGMLPPGSSLALPVPVRESPVSAPSEGLEEPLSVPELPFVPKYSCDCELEWLDNAALPSSLAAAEFELAVPVPVLLLSSAL